MSFFVLPLSYGLTGQASEETKVQNESVRMCSSPKVSRERGQTEVRGAVRKGEKRCKGALWLKVRGFREYEGGRCFKSS